ncbi:MAG TPA: lamin tail domain-containing protein, partial [Thermoanaerobaculia bacterium]
MNLRRSALAAIAALVFATSAFATSPDIVISQVYGGGGNSSATFRNDFVEVFNRSGSAVSLTGYSIQYASATGTGTFASNGVVALSGTLAAGQYYLV